MDQQKQENNSTVIYQADKSFIENSNKMKNDFQSICSKYFYHPVRIDTVQGQVFEGRIVNMDHHCVYLEISTQHRQYPYYNPYYNPYSSTVLPLVLYSLLTITLLST